jgi:hypothetical protein
MGTEWGRVESDGDGVGTGMTARERGRNGEKLMVMGWGWGQKFLPCHSLFMVIKLIVKVVLLSLMVHSLTCLCTMGTLWQLD